MTTRYGGNLRDHTAQLQAASQHIEAFHRLAAECGATFVQDEIIFETEEQRAEFERRCKEENI